MILLLVLIAAPLAACNVAAAQAPAIDLSRFDIVGLKLGQSLSEAVEALKKHNPKFLIETRRVGLQRWDNHPGCTDAATQPYRGGVFPGLPSMCGNWSDGMGLHPRDREDQKKISPEDSLVAGVVAYDDRRKLGDFIKGYSPRTRTIIDPGEETISLVVTPDPGKEKVVLISRAQTFAKESTGYDDLKSQLFARYATPASLIEGLHETSPRQASILNLFFHGQPLTQRRDEDAFANCSQLGIGDFAPGTDETLRLEPPLPNRVTAPCGNVIRAYVKSYYDNTRYAHGFSVTWFDQDTLFQLSRDRVLAAKRLRDEKFNRSPASGKTGSPGIKF
jgi:hypothetical protein